MLDLSQNQTWASVQNLVPLPYRRVSVQHYDGPMTEQAITELLLNREAYRRTDFIVLRSNKGETAVVAITRAAPPQSPGSASCGGRTTRATKIVWAGKASLKLR